MTTMKTRALQRSALRVALRLILDEIDEIKRTEDHEEALKSLDFARLQIRKLIQEKGGAS